MADGHRELSQTLHDVACGIDAGNAGRAAAVHCHLTCVVKAGTQ